MIIDNSKKVLLVTGSSRGIGKFIAEYYCSRDFIVVGCSRGEASFNHQNYFHVCLDISIEKDILELFKYIRKDFKRLDILINNAAINPAILSGALLPYNTIENVFKVNVFAAMLFCREATKLMLRNKSGRIINMGSMAAKHEVAGEALYTSTKSALNAYTRVLAKEVSQMGITVNVVAPAAIKTELSAKINQAALREVLSRNAIQDFGEFADVTNIIDFLVKTDSNAITGQIIYLGGA